MELIESERQDLCMSFLNLEGMKSAEIRQRFFFLFEKIFLQNQLGLVSPKTAKADEQRVYSCSNPKEQAFFTAFNTLFSP